MSSIAVQTDFWFCNKPRHNIEKFLEEINKDDELVYFINHNQIAYPTNTRGTKNKMRSLVTRSKGLVPDDSGEFHITIHPIVALNLKTFITYDISSSSTEDAKSKKRVHETLNYETSQKIVQSSVYPSAFDVLKEYVPSQKQSIQSNLNNTCMIIYRPYFTFQQPINLLFQSF
jgi:hypothetical protein